MKVTRVITIEGNKKDVMDCLLHSCPLGSTTIEVANLIITSELKEDDGCDPLKKSLSDLIGKKHFTKRIHE